MLKFARINSKSEDKLFKGTKTTKPDKIVSSTITIDQPSEILVPDEVAMQKTIVLSDLKRHFQVAEGNSEKPASAQLPTFTVSITVRETTPKMTARSINDDFYRSFEPIENFQLSSIEDSFQHPIESLPFVPDVPTITITHDNEAVNELQTQAERLPSSSSPEVQQSATSPPTRSDVDVTLCWAGPYIEQPQEQDILQSVQNAFLTKKKLEKEELELARLTSELHTTQTACHTLQDKLSSQNLPFGVQHALHRQLKELQNRTTQLKQAIDSQKNSIQELGDSFDLLMEQGRQSIQEQNTCKHK